MYFSLGIVGWGGGTIDTMPSQNMYRAIYELYIHCIYNMYTYVDHIIAYDFNMYEYDPHNKDTIDYIICSNMTCNYNNMSRCIERYVQKSSQTDAVVWNTLFGR